MAKGKMLPLTIQIAGRMDKSLVSAINGTKSRVGDLASTVSKIGTVGLAAMGALATGTVKMLSDCTNEATKYQNAMSDVIKYVDGLADAQGRIGKNAIGTAENGKTYAKNYETVYDAILNISTAVPMAKEELAELTALMGQSGKTIEQMFTFDKKGNVTGGLIKDAAVMAAAWDITAQEAADYGAKWENSFGMTHEKVMELANQINFLGANSATTAAELANAVNSAASLGQLAGFEPSTVAALADAMLATGVSSDRVGTSIKRMALNLSKGADMTDKQKAVLAEMGMTAEQVSKGLIKDNAGTIKQLFEGINQLPSERRLNAVGQLFGVWAAEGGAKIANNLEVYEKAMEMVGDPAKYNNSMQREFDIKTASPEAIRQMRDSAIEMFQVGIGESFLPAQAQMDEALRKLFLQLNDNMPQLQQLAGTFADLASKGITKAGEAIQDALPYVQRLLDYINNNGPQVGKILGGLTGAFTAMKFAPGITKLLGGAGSLLLGARSGENGTGARTGGLAGLFRGGQRVGGVIAGAAESAINAGPQTTLEATGNTIRNLVSGSSIGGIGRGIGSYLGGISTAAGKLGGAILNPATASAPITLGSTGPVAAISGALGNVGSFLGAGAGLLGNIWGPMFSGFGSLLSGALPIVGVISTIIAAVSLLNDKFDILGGIFNRLFGDEGPEKLAKFKETIAGIFNGDVIANAMDALKRKIFGVFDDDEGWTGGLLGNLLPDGTIEMLAGAFDGLTQIIQSVMGVIGQVVSFANTYVKPIIQDIFGYITQTVVPILLQTFTAAAPTISAILSNLGSAVMTVAQIIAMAIQAALPIIETVITIIMSIASVAIPAVLAGFEAFSAGILGAVSAAQTIFQGIIDFISGVFTLNWEQAWLGVREIFGGIFSGLAALVKAPVNAIISALNSISVNVPDWVPSWTPFIGKYAGQTVSPFNIPLLARGGFTAGPSIAGENGTEAVISFQRSARAQNIEIWRQAGRMLGQNQSAELRSLPASAGGGNGFSFTFSPQIVIQGNADRDTVDRALGESEARFEAWLEANFDRLLARAMREQSRRAYA